MKKIITAEETTKDTQIKMKYAGTCLPKTTKTMMIDFLDN
jgi:hypothetical protein